MVVWAETIEKHTLLFIFLTTPGPGSLDTKNARPKGLTIFVARLYHDVRTEFEQNI